MSTGVGRCVTGCVDVLCQVGGCWGQVVCTWEAVFRGLVLTIS